MNTKILILGDIYPKDVVDFPEVNCDFCVGNLECAITNNAKPIFKDGPSLRINNDEAQSLKKIGLNFVSLANNHVCDFGSKGLEDTKEFLTSNNIDYAGLIDEKHFYIKIINELTIGIYCVSEHQYNSLDDGIGVNVLDEERCGSEIKLLSTKCDYLIVLFHGGKEYYEYPTPLQEKTCRKFVDSGANLVVCQHSHCVGTKEKYNGSEIVYGQGNYVFPYSNNEMFKSSLIIELNFKGKELVDINYVPVVHKEKDVVRYANNNEIREIIKDFDEKSLKLSQNGSAALFKKYIQIEGYDFLYHLLNKGKLYTRIDSSRMFKHKMLKRYIKKHKQYFLYLFNYFNCETHVEFIKEILNSINKEGQNE